MTHANRLGLFIHWGLYTLPARHQQALARLSLGREEYESLMHRFNSVNYHPEEWIKMAQEAGMNTGDERPFETGIPA